MVHEMEERDIEEMIRFHYQMLDDGEFEKLLSQMHEDVYYKHPPIWDFETSGEYEGIDELRAHYDGRGERNTQHLLEDVKVFGNEAIAFCYFTVDGGDDGTAVVYFKFKDGKIYLYEYGSCPGRFKFF
jgi:ketosteroid isomerase-like protein